MRDTRFKANPQLKGFLEQAPTESDKTEKPELSLPPTKRPGQRSLNDRASRHKSSDATSSYRRTHYSMQTRIIREDVNMRVRGRHNHYEVTTGSLTQTVSQQQDRALKRAKVKEVKRRMRQISELAEFREKKLQQEMELLKLEQLAFEKEQKKQQKKDKRRKEYMKK